MTDNIEDLNDRLTQMRSDMIARLAVAQKRTDAAFGTIIETLD